MNEGVNIWKWIVIIGALLAFLAVGGCTTMVALVGLSGAAATDTPSKGGVSPQEGTESPQEKPEKVYAVGETVQVANVEWTVSDAYRTPVLESTFGTSKQGDFIVVDFTFTNNRSEEVTLDPEMHMILKDSQGREFGTDVDAWEYVPPELNLFLEPVNPGVTQDGRVIYEVSPDAQGFTLTVDDVEMMEDKSATYDLSAIPSVSAGGDGAANATASASASASASAVATETSSDAGMSQGESNAVKAAAVYYDAAAMGDWDSTYSQLSATSQAYYSLEDWRAANDALGVGTFEVLDATETDPGVYTVSILASGTPRDVVFIDEGGYFYHDLTADEYAIFDSAL
jgi:Domain of unknown function (DUF4352)